MIRSSRRTLALAAVLSLSAASTASAAGETTDATVSGVTAGTVSVAVPLPGAMTLTPSTAQNDSVGGNVLVSSTEANGWTLKVTDPGSTPGTMDLDAASAALPICSNSTFTSPSLNTALHVLTGAPTLLGSATNVADVALDGTSKTIASDNDSLAAELPVTYRQATVSADKLRAGCNYTIQVRYTITSGVA